MDFYGILKFYIIFVYFLKVFKQCLLKTYLGEGDRSRKKWDTYVHRL